MRLPPGGSPPGSALGGDQLQLGRVVEDDVIVAQLVHHGFGGALAADRLADRLGVRTAAVVEGDDLAVVGGELVGAHPEHAPETAGRERHETAGGAAPGGGGRDRAARPGVAAVPAPGGGL